MSAVLLVAHGSRDPGAGATTRALARAVAAERPGSTVRAAFLDHAGPRPDDELARFQADGHHEVTVVPLLLTAAYHRKVDVPAVVAKAPVPVTVTDIVGPVAGRVPAALLDGLHRRLAETGTPFDAVVLAAAGTRDRAARSTVELSARALAHRLGVPCLAAYASASAPTPGEAVAALQRRGARRVAVGTYFLAPGRLYDAAVDSARDAGAVAAARPLGAASELVRLVLARVGAAEPRAVAA